MVDFLKHMLFKLNTFNIPFNYIIVFEINNVNIIFKNINIKIKNINIRL